MTCEYLNCKFKTKGKNEFCGRHQKLGKKLKNPELYCTKKSCANLRAENSKRCQKCIAQKQKKEASKIPCQYPNCKFSVKRKSESNEFCGKHIKLGAKLKNPELYCTKDNCGNLRVEGHKSCKKCLDQSRKFEEIRKKKRKQIPKTKCRLCEKEIEDYTTLSGNNPTLCKYHYELETLREERRPERDRKEQYNEYDENRRDDPERLQWKHDYNRSLKCRLIYYKYKSNTCERRKWELTDEFATNLFLSKCKYCGKQGIIGDLNGIDRIDNDIWYTNKNSVSCCKPCNMMKKDNDLEFFLEHCRNIARHHNNNNRLNN